MDNEGLDSSKMQTNIFGKKNKILRGTEQGSCPEAGITKMTEEEGSQGALGLGGAAVPFYISS